VRREGEVVAKIGREHQPSRPEHGIGREAQHAEGAGAGSDGALNDQGEHSVHLTISLLLWSRAILAVCANQARQNGFVASR
jgi:hypothetical protein